MRTKHLVRLGAVVTGVVLMAAACGDDDSSGSSATTTGGSASTAAGAATTAAGGGSALVVPGDGSVKCSNLTIASFQALTGDAAGLGIPIKNGADLAIKKFNEKNKGCQIKFQPEDSQGSPDQAPGLSKKLVDQSDVIGVVGPAFSGESKNAGPTFAAAGLATITPSATNPDLSKNGWKTFHRALAGDGVQGSGIAKYLKDTVKPTKMAVLDDASTYGAGLAGIVKQNMGSAVTVTDTIDPKASDYSSTVTKVKSGNVDAVFFGGYYEAAGRLSKQLDDAGVSAQFVFGDGVKDDGYIKAGGAAAEGAIITCTCAPAEKLAEGAAFVTEFTKAYGVAPGTYAAEAFDSANMMLSGIAAGKQTRADLLSFVNSSDYKGITKTLKFDATGEVTSTAVYAFKVDGGKIVGVSQIQ